MKNTPPWVWIGFAVCLFLIFGDSKGCSLPVTTKAPYIVPEGTPITVAVAYDATPANALQMTKDYPGVIGWIQNWTYANKGDFRLIDTTNKSEPQFDAEWVKGAWKAIDKDHPPTVIAATPKTGVSSTPLPKTVDDVSKLLSPLLQK
jgi:hypothetical protein